MKWKEHFSVLPFNNWNFKRNAILIFINFALLWIPVEEKENKYNWKIHHTKIIIEDLWIHPARARHMDQDKRVHPNLVYQKTLYCSQTSKERRRFENGLEIHTIFRIPFLFFSWTGAKSLYCFSAFDIEPGSY